MASSARKLTVCFTENQIRTNLKTLLGFEIEELTEMRLEDSSNARKVLVARNID